jgi:hypothetical protein
MNGWYAIGGRWKARVVGHTPNQRLHYGILLSAVQELVDDWDGRRRTGADRVLLSKHTDATWQWVTGASALVTFSECCRVTGFDEGLIRHVLLKRLGGGAVEVS